MTPYNNKQSLTSFSLVQLSNLTSPLSLANNVQFHVTSILYFCLAQITTKSKYCTFNIFCNATESRTYFLYLHRLYLGRCVHCTGGIFSMCTLVLHSNTIDIVPGTLQYIKKLSKQHLQFLLLLTIAGTQNIIYSGKQASLLNE